MTGLFIKNSLPWHLRLRSALPGTIILACACAILLLTAPTNGDFWWFDAPSHAMNGVFIRDFVAAMPWRDPVGFAIDYYIRYPAVTILFYPPLFPIVEAFFFAVFGVSHFVAQLTVTAFLFAFALGTRQVARLWMSDAAAVGVGLTALGLPLVTLWGRQVMLEMPAYAFLIWSIYYLVRYLPDQQTWQIVLAVVLLVAGLYVKQTIVFGALVFAVMLVWRHGLSVFAQRRLWIAAAIAVVLLAPLAAITLRFGSMNMDLATGEAASQGPHHLWSSLGYYAELLPAQAGIVVLGLAVLFVVLEIVAPQRGWRDPLLVTSLVTFAVGYVFFTVIHLKDDRYTIHILAPLALFAVAALYRLIPTRLAGPACFIFGLGVFAYGTTAVAVPRVDGHKAAAELVAALAPERTTILFNGQRSASFIFNLRANSPRSDLHVLRAEKLLVHYRQGRSTDTHPLPVSRAEIESYFKRFRIRYVVFESGFWTDIETIATLESVLSAAPFSLVRVVHVAANTPHHDHELRIYRYDGPIAETVEPFAFDMPLIGGRFSEHNK
jgi:4-amino-4-deoxy-L-arabinose transferase-like glycosyltransferase